MIHLGLAKKVAFLLILALVCTLIPMVALADSPSWSYAVNNDGTITINGFTAPVGASYDTLTIPSSLDGKTVTGIVHVFNTVSSFSHLVIPSTVTVIGDYSVYYCNGVKSISMLGNVTFIGEAAFRGCPLLDSVNIPSTVTSIGAMAFYGDSGLSGSIAIPAGVAVLNENAFYNCSKISGVTLSNGLTTINNNAFENCTGLTELSIPATVSTIDIGAFIGCTNLASFTVDSANNTFSSQDGIIYNKDKTMPVRCPQGKAGAVSMPGTVTAIGDAAFMLCSKLTGITIPGSVSSIGMGAFMSCSGLADITIPGSVKAIGMAAFGGCSGLKSLNLPSSATTLGASAFNGCTGLTGFTLPDGVTTASAGLFSGCTGLTSVTLSSSLSSIEANAFAGCTSLAKCIFKSDVPAIDATAYPAQGFTAYYHLGNTTWSSYTTQPKQAYVVMTVYPQNGDAASQLVATVNGGNIAAPATPVRAGCTFLGWYKEAACVNVWDFTTAAITGDVLAYAKWAVATPAAPKALATSYNSIKVTWTAVPGVSGYEVWRATSSAGVYSPVATTSTSAYADSGLATGTTYYYKVRAYSAIAPKIYGAYSSVVYAKTALAAPASLKASAATYNSIKLTWASVLGAKKYEVYRATASGGPYAFLTTATSSSYTNTGVNTGTVYYYKVRAYLLVGSTQVNSAYSAISSTKTILAVPPSPKAARASSTSIKVTWGTVAGVTKYEVWRCTTAKGIYTLVTTTSALSFTNAKLVTGKTYYYKVRAYRLVMGAKVYSGYSPTVSAKP